MLLLRIRPRGYPKHSPSVRPERRARKARPESKGQRGKSGALQPGRTERAVPSTGARRHRAPILRSSPAHPGPARPCLAGRPCARRAAAVEVAHLASGLKSRPVHPLAPLATTPANCFRSTRIFLAWPFCISRTPRTLRIPRIFGLLRCDCFAFKAKPGIWPQAEKLCSRSWPLSPKTRPYFFTRIGADEATRSGRAAPRCLRPRWCE